MNVSPAQRVHNSIQAVILLGFALYLAYLVKSGSLHFFLSPRTERWIYFCPIPLGLMAVFTAYRAIAPEDDPLCDCDHSAPKSRFKRSVIYGLLVMPLAFGTLLPNRSLGSSAAATKGFSLTAPLQDSHIPKNAAAEASVSESGNTADAGSEGGNDRAGTGRAETPASKPNSRSSGGVKVFTAPDKYNEEFAELAGLLYAQPVINVTPDIFSETIGAIELFKHDFVGKQISVTGFVYKDETIGKQTGEFAVGRFLVLCCTADALPFGVMVKAPADDTAKLAKDSWVKVTGTIGIEQAEGKEVLRIDAAKIAPVAEPAVPYVYPSADSVSAFKQDQGGSPGSGS